MQSLWKPKLKSFCLSDWNAFIVILHINFVQHINKIVSALSEHLSPFSFSYTCCTSSVTIHFIRLSSYKTQLSTRPLFLPLYLMQVFFNNKKSIWIHPEWSNRDPTSPPQSHFPWVLANAMDGNVRVITFHANKMAYRTFLYWHSDNYHAGHDGNQSTFTQLVLWLCALKALSAIFSMAAVSSHHWRYALGNYPMLWREKGGSEMNRQLDFFSVFFFFLEQMLFWVVW